MDSTVMSWHGQTHTGALAVQPLAAVVTPRSQMQGRPPRCRLVGQQSCSCVSVCFSACLDCEQDTVEQLPLIRGL